MKSTISSGNISANSETMFTFGSRQFTQDLLHHPCDDLVRTKVRSQNIFLPVRSPSCLVVKHRVNWVTRIPKLLKDSVAKL